MDGGGTDILADRPVYRLFADTMSGVSFTSGSGQRGRGREETRPAVNGNWNV